MANKSMLSNKLYDRFKLFVQVILPAALTLYTALAANWSWGYVDEITASSAPIMTFLGLMLRISNKSYTNSDARFGGNLVVTENEDGVKTYLLEVHGDPAALSDQKEVTFKVS